MSNSVQYDFNGNGGAVDFYAGTANDHRMTYKEYADIQKMCVDVITESGGVELML